ncbi:putative integral membrane protein [Cryptosporidium felis]|nr:putative integral membrane protein [Cryptosporidium felis]
MVDFVNKKSEERTRNSGSENSEEIDLNAKEVLAETTISDDNTICTRGTESSIITILRSSKKEHFFDARIKSYKNKQNLIEKEGRMRLGVGLRPTVRGGCLQNKYKAYQILTLMLGVLFLLASVVGVLFLILLPKIAEFQVKNSSMKIREIDILQISRQSGGETSFEVNSVLEIEKASIHKVEFVHSLLYISYGLEGQEKKLLGDLYISQIFENQDGSLTARGRFTVKSKEAVNSLLKEVTSTISEGITRGLSGKSITFYGKGLMSIKIFGILLNNINIDKSVNSFSINSLIGEKGANEETGRESTEGSSGKSSTLQNYGFKIRDGWLTRSSGIPLRLNLKVELELGKLFGGSESREDTFLPKLNMENIGNLRFKVSFHGDEVVMINWYDVNLRSGNNIWTVSVDFPEKLNKSFRKLIMDFILGNDVSKEYLLINGDSSENDALGDILKNFEMKIPLSFVFSTIISELNPIYPKSSKLDVIDKLIRLINISQFEILQDTEDFGIAGRVRVGYINPLGDNLHFSLSSLRLYSELYDEKDHFLGDVTISLFGAQESQKSHNRALIESRNGDGTIISLIGNNDGRSNSNSGLSDFTSQQRRVPRMHPSQNLFIQQGETQKDIKHISKCRSDKESESLQVIPCYNIQDFEMELKVNTNKVEPDTKTKWLENIVLNNRKLKFLESTVDANITSIFGNSEFNGIKIRRNLLKSKSKIRLSVADGELDEDDYNFDDYYKESENSSEETLESFNIKSLTTLVDLNNVKILGEGYNNSWAIKVKVNQTESLNKLGLDKLEFGPLGVLLSFDNYTVGFIGTNLLKVEESTGIELVGVIKPEKESKTGQINRSLTQLVKSVITQDLKEIQNKTFTLEFKTYEDGKKKCKQYFNFPRFMSEEEFNVWRENQTFPLELEKERPLRNKKSWIGKLLNGQKLDIPTSILDEFEGLRIQSYIDKEMEQNSGLIKEGLCRVQSIFNKDIVLERSIESDRSQIKQEIGEKLREKNIKLSNVIFQLLMERRENDLQIPINGIFDLKIPNMISKELYIEMESINFKLELFEKLRSQKVLEFEYSQQFSNGNRVDNEANQIPNKVESLDLGFNIEESLVKLHDENNQLTNTLYSLLDLPDLTYEKIKDLEVRSTVGIGLMSSIGLLSLENIVLLAGLSIPSCRRTRDMELSAGESNISSIFKVESIQIQKIRLILPPRGIDIQLNALISVPNYVDDVKFDVVMGQCVFELKNEQDHLLAIVKTPKKVIIGNNRVTESVCHGFVPAKSWLPMMNLLGSEEGDEQLHISAVNTPHGIPYWLVPVFGLLKLPASNTFGGLDSAEFGSVSFS